MEDNAHKYALPRLAEGIRRAADIVAPTMGAAGTNVILQAKLPPYAIVTNDGATIIKALQFSDPIENMGLGFLQEAVERSNANSGDGSTTTCVLLNAILEEGIKSGVNSLEIKKSLDECLPLIEKSIDDQTRTISVEDIPAVARIAGESEDLARILGEIYKTIGKEGIVHLEGSGTYDSRVDYIEGVRFAGTGYLSPYMANDEDARNANRKETKAVYHKPAILVTKRKIEHVKEIEPLLQALIAKGAKTLVIFTDDMDSNVARLLVDLQRKPDRTLNILIIKAPVLWKGYIFEDFAKVTNSTIIEDAAGINFKNLTLDHLGTCGTLICDKEETTVISIADISDHIAELKQGGTTDDKLRLSWLTTKTAILKLGAKSETELGYLRLKAEDAIHSSRLAFQGGIVAGGGVALLNTTIVLPDTIGGKILKRALEAPIAQIMRNAGQLVPPENGFDGITFANSPDNGFDVKTGLVVNMFDAGIVDAALIVKGAIRNALGIASTILTTSSVVTLPKLTQQELMNSAIMSQSPFA